MKKPTCKRLKYLIKDEKKTSKEYSGYGFKKQAKQESEHSKFFKKEYEKRCK